MRYNAPPPMPETPRDIPGLPNHAPNQVKDPLITRIDLYKLKVKGDTYDQDGALVDAVTVVKFADEWTASTPPLSRETKTDLDFDFAVSWMREHGWTVRTWGYGARGWLGEALPVRDKAGIMAKRRMVEKDTRFRDYLLDNVSRLDLAFDL